MVFGLFFVVIGAFLLLWGLHGFGFLTTVGTGSTPAAKPASSGGQP